MAVGARDHIDRLLVQKYSEEKVDNHDNLPSMVDPKKMLEAMNDYAHVHKRMLDLQVKLKSVCAKANAQSAYYRSSLVS